MADSSGKMSTTQQPITKFLIVCGAKAASDSWLFGNFLGFCRALQILGVEGDFWSCFPIRQYFDGLYDSIKFGKRGTGESPEEQESIEIFTKAQYWREVLGPNLLELCRPVV